MHPLVADGGELSILRTVASHAWGRWEVEWPDSVPEDSQNLPPEGKELGFIHALPAAPSGRLARRFVRADVSITAAEYTLEGEIIPLSGFSDVEQVLDAAASRTEGGAFVERDINRSGLGALVPRVDFDVGDVVPVMVWGKILRLPVTLIEAVTSEGAVIDWNVHVGSQVVDSAAREQSLLALKRDIAVERRERLRDSGEVRTAARVAQATADTAVEDARRLTESLSGPDATTATVFEQLEQLTDDLEGQGLPALEGLLPNYIQLNTRLWQQQDEINALQAEINTTSAEDRGQIRELVGELQRAQSRELLRPVLSGDERWSVDGGTITALGSWTGTVLTFGTSRHSGVDNTYYTLTEIHTLPVPQSNGSRVYPYVSAAVYLASEGEQRTRSLEAGILDVERGSLTRLDAYDFVAETDIEDFYVSFVAWLDAADRGTRYRLEVQVNGELLYGLNWTKIGPLGPLGNGHRQMTLSKSNLTLKKGDVVSFHYMSEGEEASQRRLRSSEVFLSWIEPQEGI